MRISWLSRRSLLLMTSFVITFGLAYLAVILPVASTAADPGLQVGQVASQDILAPRPLQYESEILTGQQRDAAASLVAPVYSLPDPSQARTQVGLLRDALSFINVVRQDAFADTEQQLVDLAALEGIQLTQETGILLLALSDTRWQAVQQEAISVLEQVMRNPIREDRLEEARRGISARVSLAFPEEQAAAVAELVAAFIAPNSFFSPDLTESAQQAARDAVQPVTRTVLFGEAIVQRGRVITAVDIEALEVAGLINQSQPWRLYLGAAGAVLFSAVLTALYFVRRPRELKDSYAVLVMIGLFLVFLFSARLTIVANPALATIFPLGAYSLTVGALFGMQTALVFALPMALLTAFGLPGSATLTIYYLAGSVLGVFVLGYARRVSAFVRASLAVAFGGAVILLAEMLVDGSSLAWGDVVTPLGSAAAHGLVAAGVTVLLQFLLSQAIGMITPLQLVELARPDHPLLQYILRRAPGTYQHSLQVSNLAEQAAENIQADSVLTRIGALYHDAGKALNPMYFIENQLTLDHNPHDDLDPMASAEIIIRHVTDGLDLARKHRLPRRILDFIAEHHGTSVTRYQYTNAIQLVEHAEDVDVADFTYPGPRPRSRETAILMLADGVEATVRARNPRSDEEIAETINTIIETRIAEGQLDEAPLSLRDLNIIRESFLTTLRGLHHPRINYPRLRQAGEMPKAALPAGDVQADPTPTMPLQPAGKQSAEDADLGFSDPEI